MVKPKLILICQSGGEFSTNDDGSMSYSGGEAHAIEINCETLFDNLKLKIAEMLNLKYKTLSIKYFLPGNRQTLITLSNDKDLKRMYEFHQNSITADIFVSGRAGFDHEALNTSSRKSEIKVSETITPNGGDTPPSLLHRTSAPATAVTPDRPTSLDSVMSVTVTNPSGPTAGISPNLYPVTVTYDEASASSTPGDSVPDSIEGIPSKSMATDMDSSPADIVKKRRCTASWKFGVNGPTIVPQEDNFGDRRQKECWRKNIDNKSNAAYVDELQCRELNSLRGDGSESFSSPSVACVTQSPIVASWKDVITGVGQDFKSVHEFRDTLQKYAIAQRFSYRLTKNDTKRASGRCMVEGCPWRIHASWVPSASSFRIKKMNESHTCGGESWKAAHPTKNWLVSIIKDRLQESPHHKPKEIAKGIFQDYGLALNYTQVWRAIEDARQQLQGSHKESYNGLPGFCEKMADANPGSIIKLSTSNDKRFERLFISFHALINGFKSYCRPLIFLDATLLKSNFHEDLLIATALDGDEGAFPVAFAVVDNENDDNWRWFLEQLKCVLTNPQPMTIVSDREKGLKKIVLEVFDNAHYSYSIYHLLESFKRNLKGPFYGEGRASLPGNFMAAAQAARFDGFKMYLEQIKRVSASTHDWVMQIDPEHWANSVTKGERCNHIVLNIAEIYNNWIEEVRELPILQKLEAMISKIVDLIKARHMNTTVWPAKLVPSKEEKLQEETDKSHNLKVLISSETLFEVHDDCIHVADISKWECSCLKWKQTGLPCRHAIAVFYYTGRNAYDYCSRYFTIDYFRRLYSESINTAGSVITASASDDPLISEEVRQEIVLPPRPSTARSPSLQKKILVKRSKN